MTIADLEKEYYGNRDNVSVVVRGSAVAPLINGIIATITPVAGVYEVTALARYGAVADAVDNMNVRVAGVAVLTLPVIPVINSLPVQVKILVRLDGTQALTVNAIAAGVATSVYIAHLVATKIGN